MGARHVVRNLARSVVGLPGIGADPDPVLRLPAFEMPGVDVGARLEGSARYVAFENVFYEASTVVPRLEKNYLPLLKECCLDGTILDLGVGRGEFIRLMTDAGLQARGCEINEIEQRELRSRGHDIELADARSFLEGMPNESAAAVTAIHVVEHLEPDYLVDVLNLIGAKLRPGGLVILETPNTLSPLVAQHVFWLDLWHVRPCPLETLQFYLANAGVARFEYWYSAPHILPEGPSSVPQSNYFNAVLVGWKVQALKRECSPPSRRARTTPNAQASS